VTSTGLVRSQTSGTGEGDNLPTLVWDSRLGRVFKSVSRSADLLQSQTTGAGFRVKTAMVTLTYRPDVYWGARHVSNFLMHVRKWLARRNEAARYVWVAELQKNGRVHYHVVFWLRPGLTMPKPDKQGWWPHGMTRIEWARKPVGYLVKYCSKGRSSDGLWFPRGCRLSGFGGLEPAARLERTWWVLPRYQRERCMPEDRVLRAPGGGWFSRLTGEWWPSYWPAVGEWFAIQKRDVQCFA